jgi:ketosteroid isomerase-like protein
MIVQNGVIFRTRREAYEAVKRGLRGVVKVERKFENPAVTVVAPDVALLVADGNTTATLADGRVMASRFAVSMVWVLRDGRWQVLHGHYSMPAGPR